MGGADRVHDVAGLIGAIRSREGLPRWMPGRLPMLASVGGSHGMNPLLALIVGGVVLTLSVVTVAPVVDVLTAFSDDLPQALWFWLRMPLSFLAIFILLFVILLIKRRGCGPWRGLGFFRLRPGYEIAVGSGLALAALAVPVLSLMASGDLRLAWGPDDPQIWPLALVSLLAFVVQGSGEEVLMRGWLMPELATRIGMWGAVGVTSVGFSLLHVFNPSIGLLPLINIALVGVFFALLMVAQGAIWGACAFHAVWNWAQSVGLGIEVSGVEVPTKIVSASVAQDAPAWLTGGAFGVEGSALTSVMLVVLIGLTWRAGQRSGRWSATVAAARGRALAA